MALLLLQDDVIGLRERQVAALGVLGELEGRRPVDHEVEEGGIQPVPDLDVRLVTGEARAGPLAVPDIDVHVHAELAHELGQELEMLELLVLESRDPDLVLDRRRVQDALPEHFCGGDLPAGLLVHQREHHLPVGVVRDLVLGANTRRGHRGPPCKRG